MVSRKAVGVTFSIVYDNISSLRIGVQIGQLARARPARVVRHVLHSPSASIVALRML
jgi:hypothetical protein